MLRLGLVLCGLPLAVLTLLWVAADATASLSGHAGVTDPTGAAALLLDPLDLEGAWGHAIGPAPLFWVVALSLVVGQAATGLIVYRALGRTVRPDRG